MSAARPPVYRPHRTDVDECLLSASGPFSSPFRRSPTLNRKEVSSNGTGADITVSCPPVGEEEEEPLLDGEGATEAGEAGGLQEPVDGGLSFACECVSLSLP